MEMAIALIWFVGMVVGMVVVRHRAGVGQGRIKIIGRDGFGFVWFWRMVFAIAFWPVTLVIWLARGRPEARTVFNERAEQRRRSMQGR